jgi:transposase-like protein
MEATHEPKTLQEAILYFADPENCLNYLVARRPEWKNGVICPRCGSSSVGFLKNQMRWQCSNRHPKRQFSVKVGTIMEDSPIGLDKWLPAMWMLQNSKNGISSCEIARALGVTQKTAWFLLHRIRLAQQGKNSGKLSGHIEVDETFIGGKARNMHASKRAKNRPFEKAVVMGGSLKNTSAKDRTSIPTNCSPIGAWRISTPTKSSITRRHMWKARFTPTAWKTSGVC